MPSIATIGVSLSLDGEKKLRRKLERLPAKVQTVIERKGLRAASSPMVKEMKRRVPVDEKVLKRSIGRRFRTRRGVPMVIIGPRRNRRTVITTEDGATVVRWPTKYAHLIEFGTRHSPAQPFMRPAFEATKSQAIKLLADKIREEIESQARKP